MMSQALWPSWDHMPNTSRLDLGERGQPLASLGHVSTLEYRDWRMLGVGGGMDPLVKSGAVSGRERVNVG